VNPLPLASHFLSLAQLFPLAGQGNVPYAKIHEIDKKPSKNMDSLKTDLVIKYALAVASQNDDYRDRQLGPIHLIKYVYIADLAYAQGHEGKSFTETEWRFYKFGPWSPEVFNRIEPALEAVGADKTEISHPNYEDDFVRWRLDDEELAIQLAAQLPISVSIAVQNSVRSFGSDTASLLNHVYLTKPMLTAAPGDSLDLSPEPKLEKVCETTPETHAQKQFGKKDKDARKKKLETLRALVRERLEEKKRNSEFVLPDPLPRYDEVFKEGLASLDLEVGPPLEEGENKAAFADDVWKSRARYDPKLP
jgi:hypothetical protein